MVKEMTWQTFIFKTVFPHRDFLHEKFRLHFPGKGSCDRVALPNLRYMLQCFSVFVILRTLTWTTGSLTCAQMLMYAMHTGMHRHHKRVCPESWLWEENPLPHRRIKPTPAVCRSDVLPTELHPYTGRDFFFFALKGITWQTLFWWQE